MTTNAATKEGSPMSDECKFDLIFTNMKSQYLPKIEEKNSGKGPNHNHKIASPKIVHIKGW